jgi:hypothetical protein
MQTDSTPPPEISRLATAEEVRNKTPEAKPDPPVTSPEKSTAHEEPVYQVLMPPLTYDPHSKVPPAFDPKLIVLIRRVRVRPTLIFQGRVEGETVAAATPPPPVPRAPATSVPAKATPPANDGFVDRVKNFIRRLWSSS